MCKKIKNFDDSLLISCQKKDDIVLLKSGTVDSVELKLGLSEDKLIKVKIEEDIQIMVLLKIVMFFCKGDKFTDKLTINIEDEDMAIQFVYSFDKSNIIFYTSPQDISD